MAPDNRIATLPVLLIVTFWPEFEAPRVGQPRVTALASTGWDTATSAA
jgi:hypothetical protein